MKTTIKQLTASDSRLMTLLRIIAFLLAVAWNINCFGQDTLFMSNKEIIAGQIVEISTTEIRYKKAGNPDGPLYISLKKEVDKIRYKNGTVESFGFQKPWLVPDAPLAPAQQSADPVLKKEIVTTNFLSSAAPPEYPISKPKYTLQKYGSRFALGDNYMNENQMYKTLLGMNDRKLTEEINAAKRCRARQYYGFVAFPFLFGGLAALSSGENNETGVALLGVSAVCFGTSIYLKSSRNKHNAEIIKLYNQLN